MKYIKLFDNYQNNNNLIIVDVQKSFRKWFTEMYVYKVKQYAKQYNNVYVIWDNHHEGDNVDKDYLYDENPKIPVGDEVYNFKKGQHLIEKRYQYNVTVDYYKKILDDKTFKYIKDRETKNILKTGEYFLTNQGTIIVYIGNNHKWMHVGKKLYNILNSLKGQEVTIIGGSEKECLKDIVISARSLGVIIKEDLGYIYSASNCPIK